VEEEEEEEDDGEDAVMDPTGDALFDTTCLAVVGGGGGGGGEASGVTCGRGCSGKEPPFPAAARSPPVALITASRRIDDRRRSLDFVTIAVGLVLFGEPGLLVAWTLAWVLVVDAIVPIGREGEPSPTPGTSGGGVGGEGGTVTSPCVPGAFDAANLAAMLGVTSFGGDEGDGDNAGGRCCCCFPGGGTTCILSFGGAFALGGAFTLGAVGVAGVVVGVAVGVVAGADCLASF